MKRLISIGLAASLALSVTGSAFAISTGGSVTEGFTKEASISMTIPAGPIGYTAAGSVFTSAPINITNLTTDDPKGLTVKAKASDLVSGANIVLSTKRQSTQTGSGWGTAGYVLTASIPLGGYATPTTEVTLATTGDLFGNVKAFTQVMVINDVVKPGTYSGSITYTASTNP